MQNLRNKPPSGHRHRETAAWIQERREGWGADQCRELAQQVQGSNLDQDTLTSFPIPVPFYFHVLSYCSGYGFKNSVERE